MTTTARLPVEQLFSLYAGRWADRDPAGIAALHTPDTRFWLHHGAGPVDGRDAARDAFAGLFASFPGFGFDVHRTLFGPDFWVLDWALTCTLPDTTGTALPTRFDCVDVVTLGGSGLVARKDTLIDGPQAAAALGAAR